MRYIVLSLLLFLSSCYQFSPIENYKGGIVSEIEHGRWCEHAIVYVVVKKCSSSPVKEVNPWKYYRFKVYAKEFNYQVGDTIK